MKEFLPISKKDMEEKNISQLDFVMISADAYVDHSSFGASVISRVLVRRGYKVGIIAQPDWHSTKDFMRLSKPKLGFLVASGNVDSMVAHYTVNKRRRKNDSYSPGGEVGYRPDRAVIVYCNKIREAYKDVPIIIGGIEASLRRLSHYDYWDDKVRRSILMDSSANILVYGMGEKQIVEIAEGLEAGIGIDELVYIDGTAYRTKKLKRYDDFIKLPDFNEVEKSKESFFESFKKQYENSNYPYAKALVEKYNEGYVVQNPQAKPIETIDLDDIYELPYVGKAHPCYDKLGKVPALEEVEFSITSTRGCFGGCNFCSISFHQGSIISKRSKESILKEAKKLTEKKNFKGYIHDVGGPTANFRNPACDKQYIKGQCKNKKCLFPNPCENLNIDHLEYLEILREIRNIEKVKKVFVRSGIRYDYLLYDSDNRFFEELCRYHVSGQLRIAPEHVSNKVLKLMGKPNFEKYKKFLDKFNKINNDPKQYIVEYFISSHPGSTLNDAIDLALYLNEMNINPKQVQDFYPTPATISTCMYYTNKDPLTGKYVYVAKTLEEKNMQRALIHFRNPRNYKLVKKALIKTKRTHLIGDGKKCLIREKNN